MPPTSALFNDEAGYEPAHKGRTLSAAELTDYWADLYPIVSIEDGMDEDRCAPSSREQARGQAPSVQPRRH